MVLYGCTERLKRLTCLLLGYRCLYEEILQNSLVRSGLDLTSYACMCGLFVYARVLAVILFVSPNIISG